MTLIGEFINPVTMEKLKKLVAKSEEKEDNSDVDN